MVRHRLHRRGVDELNLYGNQLTGPIPIQLGNLTKIERLILAQPGLSGPIPTQLGNLTNLRELQLWGQLTGSIPASFGNLVNLSSLNVSSNRLSGDITVPMSALRAKAPVTRLELYQENGCLTVTDPTVATWIGSFDPRWNEGCLPQ
jgi:Leucine-rich repeat (LRR) protein